MVKTISLGQCKFLNFQHNVPIRFGSLGNNSAGNYAAPGKRSKEKKNIRYNLVVGKTMSYVIVGFWGSDLCFLALKRSRPKNASPRWCSAAATKAVLPGVFGDDLAVRALCARFGAHSAFGETLGDYYVTRKKKMGKRFGKVSFIHELSVVIILK